MHGDTNKTGYWKKPLLFDRIFYILIKNRGFMNINYKQIEYKLNVHDIDDSLTRIINFLEDKKVESKNIIRIRLGIEEALIRYREDFGEDRPFVLKLSDGLGQINVSVSVKGHMLDPFLKDTQEEQNSSFMRAALANMGEMPLWRYSRGLNIISYGIKKRNLNSWTQLIIALVMAVVCGAILKMIPQEITQTIHTGILTPLLDTFMNLLSGVAGPMIFLAVVWGIYSVGDVAAFSVLGKKLLLRFLIYIAILTTVIGLIIIPAFNLMMGAAQVGGGLSEIFGMILNVVPGNIIKPFYEGNTLQILFIGIVMGVSMIIIGEKTQNVAIFVEQLNYIVQLVMEFISKLVPFFVFGSLLDIILNNQLEDIKVSYKLFAVNALGCLILVIIYLIIVEISLKVNPLIFLKKATQTLLICLTTASSAAAFFNQS